MSEWIRFSRSRPVDYAKLWYYRRQHTSRLERYVRSLVKPLRCQECGGRGGWIEPVLEDGSGPYETCVFCEGIGLITPRMRGIWLRLQREAKRK